MPQLTLAHVIAVYRSMLDMKDEHDYILATSQAIVRYSIEKDRDLSNTSGRADRVRDAVKVLVQCKILEVKPIISIFSQDGESYSHGKCYRVLKPDLTDAGLSALLKGIVDPTGQLETEVTSLRDQNARLIEQNEDLKRQLGSQGMTLAQYGDG